MAKPEEVKIPINTDFDRATAQADEEGSVKNTVLDEVLLRALKDLRKKRQPQSSGRGGEDEQDTKDQDVIVCAYVNDRDRQKKKRSDYSSW